MTDPGERTAGDAEISPHRCAVPELELGQAWTCPDPGCGRTYGQQLGPDQELVNVGELLHDLAAAFIEGGHAFTPGVPPREVQAALYRVGGQVERAARALIQINVAVPRR